MSSMNSTLNTSSPENGTDVKNAPATLTYTWVINNFHSHEANGDDVKTSQIQTMNNIVWYVLLKPNGKNEVKDTISLYLYLSASSKFPKVFALFNASIVYDEGTKKTPPKSIQVHEYTARTIEDEGRGWGWKDFWTKDEHFRTTLLSNNKLTLYIEVKYSLVQDLLIDSSYNRMSLRSDVSECNLSDNLASLLESREFTDVIISSRGRNFHAHKVILAARSKVFKAMFHNNGEKTKLNRVEMEDIRVDVVEEMLRFIYTGKCQRLDELAEGLLEVANKYDLDRLKIICGKALLSGLSVANASKILVIADSYNAKQLKNEVIEFIVSKATEVMCTAGWKSLLSKGPLIDEVFQSMARRLTSHQAEETD